MKRISSYIVSVILAGAFCFTGGFLIGSLTLEQAHPQEMPAAVTAAPAAESARPVIEQEPVQISYMVSCEDGRLCLYSVSGEGRELIREESIDPGLYPEEDRRKLEKGIFASDLENALAVWENFV